MRLPLFQSFRAVGGGEHLVTADEVLEGGLHDVTQVYVVFYE